MNLKKEYIPLLLIVLVATVIRFLNFSDLPFTHDEFSTLFRLQYDNLTDVIQIGMKQLDNHPIGTQVFYYYYTKLFGESEMAMKFPIVIFGIFSVFMTYVIGKKWFNATAGLFIASFFAVLQYTVVQSLIARMYGFGIPFILLTVYFWQFLLNDKIKTKHIIGFVISALACAYIHYFCLLFVAIVGVTGLFYVKRNNLKYYILAGVSIVVLFLPHMNIFLFQLSKGGIEGWLGKLHFSYLFKYLSLVFNHSFFVGALLIGFPLIFLKKVSDKSENTFRKIALIWFLTPIIIGFTYSMHVNNVIHERVLYFSFPFLLLYIASFIKEQNFRPKLIMVLSILIVGIASLKYERRHPDLFVKHRYKHVAESLITWQKEYNIDSLLVIKATYDKVDEYYNKKNNYSNPNQVYINAETSFSEFISLVKNSKYEYLYFGRASMLNSAFLQIAQDYYGGIVQFEYTIAGEAYLLKRNIKQRDDFCNIYNSHPHKAFDSTLISKTNDTYWGVVDVSLDTLIFSRNNWLELSVVYKQLDSIGGAKLVSSIEKGGKEIDWRCSELNDFIETDSAYVKAYLSVPLSVLNLDKKCKAKFLIWNPDNTELLIDEIEIKVYAGNPYIYGGTRHIEFNLDKYCLK